MKKLVLAFLFISYAAIASASTGGPDAYGYIWKDNAEVNGPVYNWIDITSKPGAVQVSGLADDNTTSFIPLGFQFPYYWYSTSHFKIGSNGYIIFSNGAISSPFPTIPTSVLPNDYIAAFMCDLNFNDVTNPAQCWYWSNSVDTLIVSYIDVPFWINSVPPFTGANTFQMILSKVDSSITFQYDQQIGTSSATTQFMSIGIENISGSVGLQHSYGAYPAEGSAVKFYYPQNSTFAVNDAATIFANNPETGGLFLSKDGASFSMNSRVSNTGNQTLNPFNVHMRVINATNFTQVQDTIQTSTLAPGQTQDLSANDVFNPTTAGVYRFQNRALLTGDATPANNTKTVELRVVDTTQTFIGLGYTKDTPAGAGISWQGGDAGVGIEIIPPFYPCEIRQVAFFITANPNIVDMHMLIYDNGGPDGGPGWLLDSEYVSAGTGQILINTWDTITLRTPIQIYGGSVYIGWMMDGEGIVLGTDTTSPISNRSYELLGGWSIYRSRETTDPMIRAIVTSNLTTGIPNSPSRDFIGEFYPSPTNGLVRINIDLPNTADQTLFYFYDLQGKLVDVKRVSETAIIHQTYAFDLSKLEVGMYVCKIVSGNQEFNRKLLITR